MAKCIFCAKHAQTIGSKCMACGQGYMVDENHGTDSLQLLGKLLANKYVPTRVISDDTTTVTYEGFNPAIDRVVTLVAIKPHLIKSTSDTHIIRTAIDQSSSVRQQNLLTLIDILELPELNTPVIVYEALKGVSLVDHMRTQALTPVILMHIIHQFIQAVAALHAKGICFPHISRENVRVFRSGSDAHFVKIFGFMENVLHWHGTPNTMRDDVYYVGQMALSLITGVHPPIQTVTLAPNQEVFKPIVQLFMRTMSNKEQRFETCIELQKAFDIAFDLASPKDHPGNMPLAVSQDSKRVAPQNAPISIEQILWMHRPPMAT